MSKILTPEVVLVRTKAGTLENVKNLNLWGNDIEDVSLLQQMPNLEIVSLSVNKISSLKYFSYCPKLREIYLRKNLINNLSELDYLANLPNLSVLWLWDNPCADLPNYRAQVISSLPNLVKLDNQAVSAEERNAAARGRKAPPARDPSPQLRNAQPRVEPAKRHLSPRLPPRTAAGADSPRAAKGGRSDNILCAVLALLKELDQAGLELVSREIERKLGSRH